MQVHLDHLHCGLAAVTPIVSTSIIDAPFWFFMEKKKSIYEINVWPLCLWRISHLLILPHSGA